MVRTEQKRSKPRAGIASTRRPHHRLCKRGGNPVKRRAFCAGDNTAEVENCASKLSSRGAAQSRPSGRAGVDGGECAGGGGGRAGLAPEDGAAGPVGRIPRRRHDLPAPAAAGGPPLPAPNPPRKPDTPGENETAADFRPASVAAGAPPGRGCIPGASAKLTSTEPKRVRKGAAWSRQHLRRVRQARKHRTQAGAKGRAAWPRLRFRRLRQTHKP